ncbi:MAG: sensor histidine kinase [Bacillota bacterium]
MKYAYGALIFIWLIIDLIQKPNIGIAGIASVLGALCLFIIKEKYYDSILLSLLFLAGAIAFTATYDNMLLLAGITLLDSSYKKNYYIFVTSILVILYLSTATAGFSLFLPIMLGALTGYITGIKDEKEKEFLSVLDKERSLRYQLEQTKSQLINSRKEIERITEIKERNRIAREIHDNIGHSIAGILFQMQAAVKLLDKDKDRTKGIMKLCVEKLSEALEMTRKTVYNIKTEQKMGIEHIENIIKNFEYCDVEFEHLGNFNSLSASNLELLEANIKEALTNTAKYSSASKVKIRIEQNEIFTRLYYKDNGKGCKNIKENLGLSGMRERMRNAGGTISIDGNDGFLIVCNIPNSTGN